MCGNITRLILCHFVHSFLRRKDPTQLNRLNIWNLKYCDIQTLCKKDPQEDIDFNSTLFLDSNFLLCWKILPNRLFEIIIDLPKESTVSLSKSVKRVVLIKAFTTNTFSAQPAVGISAELAFNLCGSSLVKVISIKAFKQVSKDVVITAKDIRVSLIHRPENQYGHSDVKRVLFDYFSVQRLLYSGDVIALEGHIGPRLFFMVTVTEASFPSTPYLVSNKNTRCIQSSDISSFFPSARVDVRTEFIPQSLHQLALKIGNTLHPCLIQQSPTSSTKSVVALIAGSDDGGHLLLNHLSDLLGLNLLQINCFDFWQSGGKVGAQVDAAFEQASCYAPCLVWLRNTFILSSSNPNSADTAALLLDCLVKAIVSLPCNAALVLTCKTGELDKVAKKLAKIIHFEFLVDCLKEEDRRHFFEFHSKYLKHLQKRWLLDISRGFSLPELNQMLEEARLEAIQNERPDGVLQKDIECAVRRRSKAIGDVVGVPKVPKVTWEDVGGLEEVKQLISESLQMNLSLAGGSRSLRRSGIVLYGPPGCGKTLVAKAVANQFQMAFLSVKGPELLNQYVGQSEKNLRNVFEKARAASPSVIFFDELDSLAPNRGVAGDSGGVMDRMVSQLLSEMDSIQWKTDSIVFVMAATNRPDLLDPCLLTPGRFDKAVLVKPADDVKSKERILKTICKKLCLETGLSVHEIASKCPTSMSGAELTGLMSQAVMHSIREVIRRIEKGSNELAEDVVVCRKHVDLALQQLTTSIIPAINEDYFAIQDHL